jgi:hypothetical protein
LHQPSKEDVDGRDKPGHDGQISPAPQNPANFTLIETAGFSAPNVSSPAPRRNNSPAHETIFHFARRRPETLADYQFA